MDLILAEKPSVAKLIASALNAKNSHNGYISGDQYIVTWAYGHLLTLYDMEDYDSKYAQWSLQNYPFVPDKYQYKPIVGKRNPKYKGNTQKQQLDLIKSLVNQSNITRVIIATDYDREGQVIADSILSYINNTKPTYRMLLNEWTPKSILAELQNLTPNTQMKSLSEAGFCRQQVDWLFGINWTSVASLVFDKNTTFNVGRVILPTLKILYDREIEQANFVDNLTYKMTASSLPTAKQQDECPNIENNLLTLTFRQGDIENFPDKQYLTSIQNIHLRSKKLKITEIYEEEENIYAKPFFSLTSLQTHITAKYAGWTAEKVLSVCQSLYERQYITYPRTESNYLDESSIGKTKGVLETIKKGITNPEIKERLTFKGGKSIFNNEKVHSHGAIIPTYIIPTGLNEQETLIYSEIYKRFLSKFMPVCVQNVTTIVCKVTEDTEFYTRIHQIKEPGWQLLYGKCADNSQINLNVGDIINLSQITISEEHLKPPTDHTESSILNIMEHCGKSVSGESSILLGYSIGTPATRASVLSKIKSVGYVTQYGKYLKLTTKGRYLVEHFPVRELLELDFTGKLEYNLYQIENSNLNRSDVQASLTDLMEVGTKKLKSMKGRDILTTCPHCGNFVVSGNKGYGCLGYSEGCNFSIITSELEEWLGCKLKKEILAKIINNGRVLYKKYDNMRQYIQCTTEEDGEPVFDIITESDNTSEITNF